MPQFGRGGCECILLLLGGVMDELVRSPAIFPESPRVIYGKNPLDQVICQVRFPAILRIASEPPTQFQERIRTRFPLLAEKREVKVELPGGIERVLPRELIPSTEVAYELTSEDGAWTVSLTPAFLALTCRRYERWEAFKEWLRTPLESLTEVYRPAFFTRTGLRYQDIIRRSALDLADIDWSELLSAHIAGELAVSELRPRVSHVFRELCLRDDDSLIAQLHHGFVHDKESQEICYLIDADFFTQERLRDGELLPRLDRFNREAGRLFRWCISPRLHEAMHPREFD